MALTSRHAAALLLTLGLTLATGACSTGSPSTTTPPATGQEGAPASGQVSNGATLDAAAFADLVGREDVVVLDVRTPQEFAQGHLPGALNLDVSAPGFAAGLAELDPAATYAVYCRTGNRSQAALGRMLDNGFTSAAHLAGGLDAWSAAGGEVVTG